MRARSRPRGGSSGLVTSGRSSGLVTALLLGVGSLAWAGPATAHDELRDASPRAGATVEHLPADVHLVFDQRVLADLATVRVVGPGGAELSRGAATVEDTVVTQRSDGAAPAGTYRLAFRVVSADGHPVTGGWTFRVTQGSSGVGRPVDNRSAATGAGSSSVPAPLTLAALSAALLGGVGSLVLRARVIRRAAAPE